MVEVESITKRFGVVVAVKDASFTLQTGELAGFLGPNGAGKSTLLRMLATYLCPDAGRVRIDGLDAVQHPIEVRRRVGYLPGDNPLYHEMRTDRFLAFLAKAHGYEGEGLRERLGWVTEACALQEALRKRIKECSTGFRKRIGLAGALIHDPPVLLLDEPTHGLDPLQVLAFRDLLRNLKERRTIILSSHVVSEVAEVSDRILIIHQGALLADGPLAALCAREGLARPDLQALFAHLVGRRASGEGARSESTHAR